MQLSKAGVETEHSDESVEQNDDDDSCMDEPTAPDMDEPTTPEHVEIEIPTFVTDSEQQIHAHELGSDLVISAEETSSKLVVDDTVDMILQTTCRDDEEGSQRMVCQLRKFDVLFFS